MSPTLFETTLEDHCEPPSGPNWAQGFRAWLSLRGLAMISKETAERSTWGDGCDGWTLVSTSKLHVMHERMPAGTNEVPHVHSHVRQFYFVLEGAASVCVGRILERLRQGEGVAVPEGVVHQIRNVSSEPLEFLVISSGPPRIDRHDVR